MEERFGQRFEEFSHGQTVEPRACILSELAGYTGHVGGG